MRFAASTMYDTAVPKMHVSVPTYFVAGFDHYTVHPRTDALAQRVLSGVPCATRPVIPRFCPIHGFLEGGTAERAFSVPAQPRLSHWPIATCVVRPAARQFIDEILPVPIVHGYGFRMAADAFDAGAGFTVTLGLKVSREYVRPSINRRAA